MAEHYDEQGSLVINGDTPSVGRAAITEAARSFMTVFPDMQVLMDDPVVRDEAIEYHWTLIGTNTGPGGTEIVFESLVSRSGLSAMTASLPSRRATTTRPSTTANSYTGCQRLDNEEATREPPRCADSGNIPEHSGTPPPFRLKALPLIDFAVLERTQLVHLHCGDGRAQQERRAD